MTLNTHRESEKVHTYYQCAKCGKELPVIFGEPEPCDCWGYWLELRKTLNRWAAGADEEQGQPQQEEG